MPLLPRLASLWRNLVARSRVERELDEELASYVELLTDEKVRAGTSPEEARRAALREVGRVEQVKERVREARTGAMLDSLWRDLRHAGRLLVRAPGFTTAVVASLALGVGGTTAIFSIVNATLLRPLPYPEADRLFEVRVWWNDFSAALSAADLLALREAGSSIAQVGAYFSLDDGFTLTSTSGPEVVPGAVLSTELPRVLGVAPLLGRHFSAEPEAREALISEALWRERFRGTRDALGRALELDGELFTIVGVMPAHFNVPGQRDGAVWVRYELPPPTRRGPFFLTVIARLAPGMASDGASDRLTALGVPVLRERYGVDEPWRYGIRPLKEVLVGNVRPTLRLLAAAVALVLLIGVLNFSNLLLARGLTRRHELSVRAALGAGRGRIVRQLLVEAAAVGLVSGVIGLMLAGLTLLAARRLAADVVPRMSEVHLDATVVVFAIGIGVLAGLAAGIIPALRVPWAALALELREGSRTVGRARRDGWMRRILVGAMVSLAVTVLSSAALLVGSLLRLEAADPGFDPDRVLSFRLSLPENAYPDSANGKMAAFLTEVERELRALPGVAGVGFSNALPPDRLEYSNDYSVAGAVPGQAGASDVAEWLLTSDGYFDALRIPLVRGRVFQAADRDGAARVAVVNEAFVRRHFGGSEPLGRRIKAGPVDSEGPWMTIVGIVADVPYQQGVWGGTSPTVYSPLAQNLWHRSPFVVIRSQLDPAALVPAVQAAIRRIDPALPLRDVATMEQRLRNSAAAPRLRSVLFSALAGIALALAVTGIFGVLAYEVTQRRREIAVRLALGAPGARVVASVVRMGMGLAGVGIVLGLVCALLAARALAGFLYGISPANPVVLGLAAAIVGTTALLASALPAMSAARVDPLSVLREE